MNFQFEYPEALWGLALLPVFLLLYLSYRLWKKRKAHRLGDPALVQVLLRNHSPLKSWIKWSMLVVAFALGCVALANPRQPDDQTGIARKGIDLVVAMDISNSMLAMDVAPSRLLRARQLVNRLLDEMPENRVALVLFAGHAYIQMPLTFDHGAARLHVNTATPSGIPVQGTAIADALMKSSMVFDREAERFRSVLLITDGETHDVNAPQAAKELAEMGVMINAVGIGSPEGSTIMDTATKKVKRDAAGKPVISRLNEPLLQQLAAIGNGTYVRLEKTDGAVATLMKGLGGIGKKALVDTSLFNYRTFYAWLSLPMLLLLMAELFLPDRKKVTP